MRTHCFLLLIALLVPTLAAADPVLPGPDLSLIHI